MILSGKDILRRKERGEIVITPFDKSKINPNSYNLRLHDELMVYDSDILDMKENTPTSIIKIPKEGILLEPNKLYLGRTLEYTETNNVVPMLEGRSSIGRLGLYIHVTAGFGDVGFKGYWTLELSCVQPIRIYAGVEIAQIFYHTIAGEYDKYVSGKYQNNKGIQPSLLYRELK